MIKLKHIFFLCFLFFLAGLRLESCFMQFHLVLNGFNSKDTTLFHAIRSCHISFSIFNVFVITKERFVNKKFVC